MFDPTQMDLTSYFFVMCTNMKVYLYNYSYRVEPSMNTHEGKGNVSNISFHELNKPVDLCYKCYKYCFYRIFPNVYNTKIYQDIICNNSFTFK